MRLRGCAQAGAGPGAAQVGVNGWLGRGGVGGVAPRPPPSLLAAIAPIVHCHSQSTPPAPPPYLPRRGAAQIVVATPGRLEDLLNDGALKLRDVSYLVLDEAGACLLV